MAKAILLDELHLTITAQRGLPESTLQAIYRTLRSRSFRSALDRAMRATFRRYAVLRAVRLKLWH